MKLSIITINPDHTSVDDVLDVKIADFFFKI